RGTISTASGEPGRRVRPPEGSRRHTPARRISLRVGSSYPNTARLHRVPPIPVTRTVATSSKAPRRRGALQDASRGHTPGGESDCGSGLLSKQGVGRTRYGASRHANRCRVIESAAARGALQDASRGHTPGGESDCGSGLLSKQRVGRTRYGASCHANRCHVIESAAAARRSPGRFARPQNGGQSGRGTDLRLVRGSSRLWAAANPKATGVAGGDQQG